jgi:hypothetical protein
MAAPSAENAAQPDPGLGALRSRSSDSRNNRSADRNSAPSEPIKENKSLERVIVCSVF